MSELCGAEGAGIVLPQVEHTYSGSVFDLSIKFTSVTDYEIRYEVSQNRRIGSEEVVRRGEIRVGNDLYAEFWHTN